MVFVHNQREPEVEVKFRSKKYIQMLRKLCKEAGKEAKACARVSALHLRLEQPVVRQVAQCLSTPVQCYEAAMAVLQPVASNFHVTVPELPECKFSIEL